MKAYTMGITKEQFVKEIKWHEKHDNFIKGTYGEESLDAKACAVGCSLKSVAKIKGLVNIDSSSHQLYEEYLGIPEWLARVQDAIFENLEYDRSKKWPLQFSQAVNKGADLQKIKLPFILFILNESLQTVLSLGETGQPDVNDFIKLTRQAIELMLVAQKSQDFDLISAARSAAWSAWSAARSAAESAASAARSAAWAAAESARSAAWAAAESAAWAAAESAASAAESVAAAAWAAAESAAFEKYADKLLELIKDCK